MAAPLIADLPRDIDLTSSFIIRITALNQTTGATVSGVTVSNVVITAVDVQGGGVVQITDAPSPYLVPTTSGTGGTSPSATPPPPTPPSTTVGPLHTQAAKVSDPATRAFDLAVADNLEPGGGQPVALPSGARPFHTLAFAIADSAVQLWALAVANILEP